MQSILNVPNVETFMVLSAMGLDTLVSRTYLIKSYEQLVDMV